jgi:hypothetical protein
LGETSLVMFVGLLLGSFKLGVSYLGADHFIFKASNEILYCWLFYLQLSILLQCLDLKGREVLNDLAQWMDNRGPHIIFASGV